MSGSSEDFSSLTGSSIDYYIISEQESSNISSVNMDIEIITKYWIFNKWIILCSCLLSVICLLNGIFIRTKTNFTLEVIGLICFNILNLYLINIVFLTFYNKNEIDKLEKYSTLKYHEIIKKQIIQAVILIIFMGSLSVNYFIHINQQKYWNLLLFFELISLGMSVPMLLFLIWITGMVIIFGSLILS